MKPLSPTLDSNWERRLSGETTHAIGKQFGPQQRQETLQKSLPTCTYVITSPCPELLQTMLDRLRWKGRAVYSGVLQGQANLVEPGKKQVSMLTLKTLVQNGTLFMTIGGAVTEIKSMLLSMSFVEVSTSHTYSDGWTDTQYLWKLKEEADLFEQHKFGSLQTWIPVNGTQI